jgi:CDP-diacylglycerol--serine O-phosphatidyltransferase
MKLDCAVKKIAILPTLLTLGNAVCGFASIAFASKIDGLGTPQYVSYYLLVSASLILGAMVFDALDGYVARLSRTASDFGGQLDSLCDAISFGAAPAFLLMRLGRLDWDKPLILKAFAIIATLFMVCAILRLARFNVENTPDPANHKRFKGLPSPAAAGCLASLAILRAEPFDGWSYLSNDAVVAFVRIWAPLGGLVAALLMVSRLSYPHLSKQMLRGRRNFRYLLQIILIFFAIALTPELTLFFLFWVYALNSPLRYLIYRGLHGHQPSTRAPGIDDAMRR